MQISSSDSIIATILWPNNSDHNKYANTEVESGNFNYIKNSISINIII